MIIPYPQELDDPKYNNDPKVEAIKGLYNLINVQGLDDANVAMGSIGNPQLSPTLKTWTAFTPSWTNLTPGSGTNTGAYILIGKTVICRFYFVFGSGSAVGTNPYINLPIAASAGGVGGAPMCGTIYIEDKATLGYVGNVQLIGTTAALMNVNAANGTYLFNSAITANVPMTWTTNDYMSGYFVYEAA